MSLMRKKETPRHPFMGCPACGYRADAAGSADGSRTRPPKDGDLALCVACAGINIYAKVNEDIALRLPTADERATFARSPTLQAAVQRLIEIRDQHRKGWPRGARDD